MIFLLWERKKPLWKNSGYTTRFVILLAVDSCHLEIYGVDFEARKLGRSARSAVSTKSAIHFCMPTIASMMICSDGTGRGNLEFSVFKLDHRNFYKWQQFFCAKFFAPLEAAHSLLLAP